VDTMRTRTKFVRAAVLAGTAATARRSRQMLIVLALAFVILLALSASVAHAAPEDGQDTENPANVPQGPTSQLQTLQVHASENPVVCGVLQDWKAVAVTWTPKAWANFTVTDNGEPVEEGWFWYKNLAVVCGHTYTVQVVYKSGDTWKSAPLLTITSVQAETSTPMPQAPEINPRLSPKLPDLALPTS
jgi:hypothetical protein